MTNVQWQKRGKRDETAVCHRRTWTSTCGRYRIEEHRPTLNGLQTTYYAIAGTKILGRHRVRSAAEKDCERHARQERMEVA